MIYSMTGFATRNFSFNGNENIQQFKIEIKSLNHRFLELKLRIPRELNFLETAIRSAVEKKVKRGSVEVWIERQSAGTGGQEIQLNLAHAEQVFKILKQVKNHFNLSEEINVRDISSFPEVIAKGGVASISENQIIGFQKIVDQELNQALDALLKMRAEEGSRLKDALLQITGKFKDAYVKLQSQREVIRARVKEKVKKRIEQCFEAYPTPDAQVRALMESRIAQEIAITLDKLDVEEELTRYTGHISQIEKLLEGSEPVGKKLDFLLQELNREVNTLGNKSQDLEMSQEVIQLKMWVEQLREQCMNLE